MGEWRVRKTTPGWRRHWVANGLVVVALIFAVLALHLTALSFDRSARDESRALAERVTAGRKAIAIEPFSRRFAVTYAIARAEQLQADGRTDEAYFLLLPLSTTVRDDVQFRSVYQRIAAAKWPLDARKAHQQHAKESSGGALAPEDVFK